MLSRASSRACRTTSVHHPGTVAALGHPTQMQTDLKPAMKARDSSRVAVLRATLGSARERRSRRGAEGPISLTAAAGTTEVARRELSDAEVRSIIDRERAELVAAADERESLGLPDDAAELRATGQGSELLHLMPPTSLSRHDLYRALPC